MTKHPMQPVYLDANGRARFRGNAIVQHVVEEASAGRKCDLGDIARLYFPDEDSVQFRALIGADLDHPERCNAVVRHLFHCACNGWQCDLNTLAIAAHRLKFPQADQEQFAQLIGYSVHGFHELSQISDAAALRASEAARAVGGQGGCRDTGCGIHCGVEEEA